ncbi:hypothetical protein [Massilia sp. METH4]|uniref:hypothetical protein n=1 Tax=Massilia sp. METH4 TaxID=3123041 RepID=UPI0030CC7F45
MHATVVFTRRHGRLALLILALGTALLAGLAWGARAWLFMVPALFMLGRSYGSEGSTEVSGQAQYGVGAALAGFTPRGRR